LQLRLHPDPARHPPRDLGHQVTPSLTRRMSPSSASRLAHVRSQYARFAARPASSDLLGQERRFGRRVWVILVAAVVLGIVAAALGAERSTSRQSATVKFADHRSGHSSGLRLRIDYVNPADSN